MMPPPLSVALTAVITGGAAKAVVNVALSGAEVPVALVAVAVTVFGPDVVYTTVGVAVVAPAVIVPPGVLQFQLVGLSVAEALSTTVPFALLDVAMPVIVGGSGTVTGIVTVSVSAAPSAFVTVSVIGKDPVAGKVNDGVGVVVPLIEIAPGADQLKVVALVEVLPSHDTPPPNAVQVATATGGASVTETVSVVVSVPSPLVTVSVTS